MPRKRDKQQTVLWDHAPQVRHILQDDAPCGLPLRHFIGCKEDHLVPWESCVSAERIGKGARILSRSTKPADLIVIVGINADYESPALGLRRQFFDLSNTL